MQKNTIDVDFSVDPYPAAAATVGDTKTQQLQAMQAITLLEATAPKAYSHLQQALASQAAQVVVSIPTHLIRRSAYANRMEASFDTEAFRELKESIRSSDGNTQPIIVRPVTPASSASSDAIPGVDDFLYEIVAGHRRYQCCRELGLPVKALLVPHMSDAELIVAMHHENHARQPLTPWEYGAMIKGCLDHGVYSGIRAMARSIGRDPGDLSRALALTKLPEIILQAFEAPMALQYKDADLLNNALAVNEAAVLAVATEIVNSGKNLPRTEVMQMLTRAGDRTGGVGSTNTPRKVPLRVGAKDVGSIAWDDGGKAVVRVNQAMPTQAQDELLELLTKLLGRITRPTPKREPKASQEGA